jgi:hypothetical protein
MCAVWILAIGFAAGGCAHAGHSAQRPVPIESRPTPAQPPTGADAGAGTPATTPGGETSATAAAPESATKRIEADTLATHDVLVRCAKRRLLPEQESTVDSARQLLADARAALERADLARAASLARRARQLSSSLTCPP